MTQAVKTDWAGRESALARCCNAERQLEPLVAWDGLLDGWLVFRKSWRKGPSGTGRGVGVFIRSSELVH